MSSSNSSSDSGQTPTADTCSSGVDGYWSPDVIRRGAESSFLPNSYSSTISSISSVSSIPSSSSADDVSSSESAAAPLPGAAIQQVQNPRPTDMNDYGGTYSTTNSSGTVRNFPPKKS
ncbi:unnamed protein product [Adineta ricciae]|uniref:Uncharacterized protein n=1 Tax=Adineta ricciae TaxID=249248 RepID=A0A814YUC6_ADIRI|nr:unnamed protein product [Adineta ricciae]CAF1347979.1 unnamed protein product [Adineta ricciae]